MKIFFKSIAFSLFLVCIIQIIMGMETRRTVPSRPGKSKNQQSSVRIIDFKLNNSKGEVLHIWKKIHNVKISQVIYPHKSLGKGIIVGVPGVGSTLYKSTDGNYLLKLRLYFDPSKLEPYEKSDVNYIDQNYLIYSKIHQVWVMEGYGLEGKDYFFNNGDLLTRDDIKKYAFPASDKKMRLPNPNVSFGKRYFIFHTRSFVQMTVKW